MLFREAVLAFSGMGAGAGGKESAVTNQAIGEYCRGKDIEECRKNFGEGLARTCSTCPN